MKVSDRIEQAPACEVINLTDAEKALYTGAGWKLARFRDGVLSGFFDPADTEYHSDHQAMVENAINEGIAWIEKAEGEVWLVMCSCYQLCEPRPVVLTDVSALARMARVFAEAVDVE